MNTLKRSLHDVIVIIKISGKFGSFYADSELASSEVLKGLASSLHKFWGHICKRGGSKLEFAKSLVTSGLANANRE